MSRDRSSLTKNSQLNCLIRASLIFILIWHHFYFFLHCGKHHFVKRDTEARPRYLVPHCSLAPLVPLPPSSDLPSSFPLCFSAKNPHFEEAPAVLHANRRSTPIIDVGKQGARDTSPDKNQTRDTNITYVFQACSWASLLLFQATIARSCAVPCRLSRPNKWPSRCIRPAGGKRRNPSNPRLPLFTQL